jgi:hypothetical protein
MTEPTPAHEKSLAELHADLIVRIASALTLVRLCRTTAPFCDPAFEPLEEELAQAFEVAHSASALGRDLAHAIGDPTCRAA